jgi:NAD(P)-dependent dehydrogenase (short-subunit alcohol dehydrogenase family)
MERLAGKVVLVVGGGSDGPPAAGEELAIGNGRAAAIACARAGAAVMVADRVLDAAEATARQIRADGGRGAAVACDVLEESQCAAAVRAAVAEFGALDLLVNNVGISDMGAVTDATADEIDRVLGVNVRGHALVIKHALPEIAEGRGAIVTISSLNAVRTGGAGVAYDASKAALLGLSRHVAGTAAPLGVRSNAVLPGIIDSTMLRRFTAGLGVDPAELLAPKVPLGRLGTPWDVANAVVFLLSDEASFITGTELLVDGGTAAVLM